MGRNQSVELLRVLSCFGVVAFHAKALGEVAYAGSVFLIVAAYFEASSSKRSGFAKLAARLLMPWLLAMVAFGLVAIARGQPIVRGDNLLLGLLYGTSPHLWFLPFAAASLALVRLAKRRAGLLVAGSTGLAALAVVGAPALLEAGLPEPAPQYLNAIVPFCLGAALGGLRSEVHRLLFAATWMVVLLVVRCDPHLIAVAAFTVALLRPIPWNVKPISNLMFGVYLIHPAALSAAHALHLDAWAAAAFAFAMSLAATAAFAWVRTGLPGRMQATALRSGS